LAACFFSIEKKKLYFGDGKGSLTWAVKQAPQKREE
jgi:hypothetical protein